MKRQAFIPIDTNDDFYKVYYKSGGACSYHLVEKPVMRSYSGNEYKYQINYKKSNECGNQLSDDDKKTRKKNICGGKVS